MFAVIVASHIRLRAMITVLHRDAKHRGEGRDDLARGLICEATMTKNTGLNSIISWVVDLNNRKSPFHSEYSYRSEHGS